LIFLVRKLNRRIFISTTIGAALAAAAGIGYYHNSKRTPIINENHSSVPHKTASFTSQPTTIQGSETYSPLSTLDPTIPSDAAYLAVAHGEDPSSIVEATLRAIGGINRFVSPGDDVIIKPNICVAYHSCEYAATTNPEVVGALTRLCLEAGAQRVRVMDNPFGGTTEKAYTNTGIQKEVQAAGGEMEAMSSIKYRSADIPDGIDITRWQVYGDILDADVLINVPIAKHHSLAKLTLGMKNLMGIIQSPIKFHINLSQRIADLTSCIRPTLTVVDAVRILKSHGPTGGSLEDVEKTDTVIASHDIVAADAYAATLFGLTGADIPAIRAGANMRLGTMDLDTIKIEEIFL
jgi:uncharacterized protein (DUF362 family)